MNGTEVNGNGRPRWVIPLLIFIALFVVFCCAPAGFFGVAWQNNFWGVFDTPAMASTPQESTQSGTGMTQAEVEELWNQKLAQMSEDAGANLDPGEAVSPPSGADPAVGAPKVKTRFDYAGLPDCKYKDTGSPSALGKRGEISIRLMDNGLWEADINSNGCNLVWEGRIVPDEPFHRIVTLRDIYGENTEFVTDGKFTYSEGSFWAYDRGWNMGDFLTPKPPIAAELLQWKVKVMERENSLLPINVYSYDGQVMEFPAGEIWEGTPENDNCAYTEPMYIPVHGQKLEGVNDFSAAIGAIGCQTVAWIDGASVPEVWEGQRDGARKVHYTTIEVWMMPSQWDNNQIQAWINSH